jgi:hypothetical protein
MYEIGETHESCIPRLENAMKEGSEAIVYLLPYHSMETQFVQRSVFTLLDKKTEISGKTVLEILRKTQTASPAALL